MRENCTSGTARGALGNRRSYRGGFIHMERERAAWGLLEEMLMWCSAIGCIVTLTLSLLVAPLAATAQQPVHRSIVGWLDEGIRADKGPLYATFLEGLRELGYVEEQHFVIVRRDAEGYRDRLPGLAAELVPSRSTSSSRREACQTRAAMQATTTIPIVMAEAGDPVGTGLVASLARPGANVTGLSSMGPDLVGKRLQLLKEVAPRWPASRCCTIPRRRPRSCCCRRPRLWPRCWA